MSLVFMVVLLLVVLLAMVVIGLYNALVKQRNQVKNGWAQIDVQLKRRHDLIPNLVETAKGYMNHERETLEAITKARTSAMGASGPSDQIQAEGLLSGLLGRFFALTENYPDLKASQNFLQVQGELANTEDQIGTARQVYNDQARRMNDQVETFPSNLIARMFNFEPADFFEVSAPQEREAPKVSF